MLARQPSFAGKTTFPPPDPMHSWLTERAQRFIVCGTARCYGTSTQDHAETALLHTLDDLHAVQTREADHAQSFGGSGAGDS